MSVLDHGHVDLITRRFVSGWAANIAAPDQPVSVSVFVNGTKRCEVACDLPRPDLAGFGLYGAGGHGFRHEFAPPLADEEDVAVSIRFARSGASLGHGDATLERRSIDPVIRESPQLKAEQFLCPAPSDMSSLMRIFALHEPGHGVFSLLRRLNFAGVKPGHVAFATSGEVPADQLRPAAWNESLARDALNDALHAPEFQAHVVEHVLRAYPKKRRLLFVHIPKCAGSDLSLHLSSRYVSVEQRLAEPAWTSHEELFQALARIAREARFTDSILVRGHLPLDYFIDARLIRPSDRVFTVVRDPLAIAVSQLNYVLTKFQLNITSGVVEKDTARWLDLLDLDGLPAAITPVFVREFVHQALRHPEIVPPNSMCRWLGGGGYSAVVNRLAHHQVELTSTEHYADWMPRAWGITARTRQNESMKFIALNDLASADLRFLRDASRDDRKLYAEVERAIAAAGQPSVAGDALRAG